jgi:hypothetical protein
MAAQRSDGERIRHREAKSVVNTTSMGCIISTGRLRNRKLPASAVQSSWTIMVTSDSKRISPLPISPTDRTDFSVSTVKP